MAYTVVNLDRMSGTEDSSQLLSGRFYDGNDAPAAIENGSVAVVGALETRTVNGETITEREIYKLTAPAGTEDLEDVVLVASPEVVYGYKTHYNLDEFTNEAGSAVRAYYLHQFDGFSLTADGFDGTPAKGKYVVLGDTVKLKAVATVGTDKLVGTIEDVYVQGKTSTGAARTFYYVKTVKG